MTGMDCATGLRADEALPDAADQRHEDENCKIIGFPNHRNPRKGVTIAPAPCTYRGIDDNLCG